VAERDQLPGVTAGVSAFASEILGRHVWARGYLAVSSGNITDEIVKAYIDEQEGEPLQDDSRFPIDEP
jgi:REP element-mobilizing transposase RayT